MEILNHRCLFSGMKLQSLSSNSSEGSYSGKAPKFSANPEDFFTVSANQSFSIEDNPYDTIYVDVTYKCNMSCHFCYNPVRTLPDMTLQYFSDVCEKLPRKVLFRLLGGEPTLHPQLFEFVRVAHKHRHLVSIVTNGIKLNNLEYTQGLKDLNVPLVVGMSMDGGRDNNDFYEIIENSRCAEMKMKALKNLAEVGFRRVCLSAIIVRGLNEAVIPDLLDLASQYSDTVRYVHFRTAAQVGRFKDTLPYTAVELKEIVRPFIPNVHNPHKMIRDGVNATKVGAICRGCCYEFWLNRQTQVSLIEFASFNSSRCWHRGKLMTDSTVQPFFDNMIEASKVMSRA